jgi:hypothetical protein
LVRLAAPFAVALPDEKAHTFRRQVCRDGGKSVRGVRRKSKPGRIAGV